MLHPLRSGIHLSEWASELLGTMVLVLGGLFAVVFDFGTGSPLAPILPSESARLKPDRSAPRVPGACRRWIQTE